MTSTEIAQAGTLLRFVTTGWGSRTAVSSGARNAGSTAGGGSTRGGGALIRAPSAPARPLRQGRDGMAGLGTRGDGGGNGDETIAARSGRHGAPDRAQPVVLLGRDLAAAFVADIVHGELQQRAHPVAAVVGVDRRRILAQH